MSLKTVTPIQSNPFQDLEGISPATLKTREFPMQLQTKETVRKKGFFCHFSKSPPKHCEICWQISFFGPQNLASHGLVLLLDLNVLGFLGVDIGNIPKFINTTASFSLTGNSQVLHLLLKPYFSLLLSTTPWNDEPAS